MRMFRIILASTVLSALFACGGGSTGSPNSASGGGSSSSSNNAPITYTGQYLNAPTAGLKYKASPSGLTGTTDSNGHFKFNSGDTVTFVISSPAGDIPAGISSPSTSTSENAIEVVPVLSLENGPLIAQTLQSLGGTGATIDVSRTSPNVAALTASEVASLNSYINSGGATSAPAVLVVDKDTALGNAAARIGNIKKTQIDPNLKTTFSGSTVAFIGASDGIVQNFKLKNLNITSFGADGTTNSLCIWTSTIVGPFLRPHCNDTGVWTISTSNPNSLEMIGTWRELNNITASFLTNFSGIFNLNGSNVEAVPGGITGNGVFTLLKNSFRISDVAGKTITVAGNSECSDGLMNYKISSNGTSYERACKTSTTSGYRLLCGLGSLNEVSQMPGLIKFTGGVCTAVSPTFYLGITSNSSVESGTVVIASKGSYMCTPTTQGSCGTLGLFKFSVSDL